MKDREKVIKGLDLCSNALYCADPSSRCDQCPYRTKDMTGTDEMNCSDVLMSDALALLKEEERKKGSWDYGTQCSVCKGTIVPPWKRDTRVNFCPWCGADMRDSYEQGGRRS